MAFRLDKCFCCGLATAASVIGVYTLIAYVIAISMEIWWIFQIGANPTAFVFLLCVVYLIIFGSSGFLLRGLFIRKTVYLLQWLIVIVVFSIPEAGLVFIMNIYFGKVHSLYGLTEVTCWLCRAVVNMAGVVCMQSLYKKWKEEKHVVKSLRGLHMKSLERPRRRISVIDDRVDGDVNGMTVYQNACFTDPSPESLPSRNPNLKRSASSASRYSVFSPISDQRFGGSLPYGMDNQDIYQGNMGQHGQFAIGGPFLAREFQHMSEFNASQLDLVLAGAIRNPNYRYRVGTAPLSKARSMLNLTEGDPTLPRPARKAMSVIDYDGRSRSPLPIDALDLSVGKRKVSRGYSGDLERYGTRRSTLSLRESKSGRASNIDRYSSPVRVGLGNPRLAAIDFTKTFDPRTGAPFPKTDLMLPRLYAYNTGGYGGSRSASKRSLGNESDDFQKYRDVAL